MYVVRNFESHDIITYFKTTTIGSWVLINVLTDTIFVASLIMLGSIARSNQRGNNYTTQTRS